MTITIPTWVLWTLAILVGIPAGGAILTFAWFGFIVLRALSKGGLWR